MSKLRRVLDSLTLVCLAGVVVVLVARVNTPEVKNPPTRRAATHAEYSSPSGVMLTRALMLRLRSTASFVENEDGIVDIMVFGDYSCGACSVFDSTLDKVKTRFPGIVRIAYMDLLLDTLSVASRDIHIGARCAADQGAFQTMHRAILTHQSGIHRPNGWRNLARRAELPDTEAYDDCVMQQRYSDVVLANTREAHRLGFNTTPTLVIGSRPIIGAAPFLILQEAVNREISALREIY